MARESYSTQQAKIKKQIDLLKKKAESLQNRRRKPVIAAIVRDMREYGITPEEILAAFGKSPTSKRVAAPRKAVGGAKKSVPAKYKNPETGDTWTGRGKPPRWLSDAEKSGTSRDTFLISTPAPAQAPAQTSAPQQTTASSASSVPSGTQPFQSRVQTIHRPDF